MLLSDVFYSVVLYTSSIAGPKYILKEKPKKDFLLTFSFLIFFFSM